MTTGRRSSRMGAGVIWPIVLKNSDLGASSPLSRGSHKIHRNKFNDLAGHENGEIAPKSVKIDFSGVFQHSVENGRYGVGPANNRIE